MADDLVAALRAEAQQKAYILLTREPSEWNEEGLTAVFDSIANTLVQLADALEQSQERVRELEREVHRYISIARDQAQAAIAAEAQVAEFRTASRRIQEAESVADAWEIVSALLPGNEAAAT